jgi:hypothetical protein
MVVEFPTTCAIDAYHRYCCGFEPVHGEVYTIQHDVIKFVIDFQKVGGFLRVLRFPPPIKLTTTIAEISFKVAVNTISPSFYLNRIWTCSGKRSSNGFCK